MQFIQRFRPINLLIIVATQCFFYFLILLPAFQETHGLYPTIEFTLACLLTLIVAASGYIINDIVDKDIDSINRPEKLSVDSMIWLKRYVALVLFGMVINVILCFLGSFWWYVWIFPVACFVMYLYRGVKRPSMITQ